MQIADRREKLTHLYNESFNGKDSIFMRYIAQHNKNQGAQVMMENVIGFFSEGYYKPDDLKHEIYITDLQKLMEEYINAELENSEQAYMDLKDHISEGKKFPAHASEGNQNLQNLIDQFANKLERAHEILDRPKDVKLGG